MYGATSTLLSGAASLRQGADKVLRFDVQRTGASMARVRSLLFVVNPRSGGRQGAWLLARLKERMPPERVMTIDEADVPALARLLEERGKNSGIVACGGDGTAASVIESCWLANPLKPIPVGTIPLGTGNDLARHLGWRPRRNGGSLAMLDHHIHALQVATLSGLDRWVLTGNGHSWPLYNYLSLGADARISARFHTLRRDFPWMFRATAMNKALYGFAALGEPGIKISQVVEGLPLPTWTRAVVFCNIQSYAGGTQLAPSIRADDGWIDGFALGPGLGMGLAVAGLRQPHRIARTNVVRFSLHEPLMAQFDGEPHRLEPGLYTLAHGGRARVISAAG